LSDRASEVRAILSKDPKAPITIFTENPDQETLRFVSEIVRVLRSLGWDVHSTGGNSVGSGAAKPGVLAAFGVASEAAAKNIRDAFALAGIKVDIVVSKNINPIGINLGVGPKPIPR
jgi:hypothetical protein